MKHKIKTFEGACKALGIENTLPDVSAMPEKHQKALIAHYKLVIIVEALNEGWIPDWNNWDEYKYYPWFSVDANEKNGSGFGFSPVASPILITMPASRSAWEIVWLAVQVIVSSGARVTWPCDLALSRLRTPSLLSWIPCPIGFKASKRSNSQLRNT